MTASDALTALSGEDRGFGTKALFADRFWDAHASAGGSITKKHAPAAGESNPFQFHNYENSCMKTPIPFKPSDMTSRRMGILSPCTSTEKMARSRKN